ncbi:hypothetical protein HOE67_05130 [Candidatus Peregrinibacteria bacterium]|jgi:hypothetical protein|nr:hypothetical protein [Candidatus Peregrinibacteria bacterium]MBT4056465.1 hypothetical protein [Candidatus Peregrinibacteria bacterium]
MTKEELIKALQNSTTFKENFTPEGRELLLTKIDELNDSERSRLLQILETEKQKLTEIERKKQELFEQYKQKAAGMIKSGYRKAVQHIEEKVQEQEMAPIEKQINSL